MKRTLPYLGITAVLFLGGCPPPPGDNPDPTCATDSPCGAGTVCVDAVTGPTCVEEDCNTTSNPNFCDADETCNNATGDCEAVVTQQFCTSLDGSTTVEPSKVDLTQPGGASITANLDAIQFGAEGDSADFVFQVTLPEKSDLNIKTIVPQGQSAQDTIITVRSFTCDGNVEATNDNINAVNGEAAVLNVRSLEAGDYFVFVDSKSTAPITAPVQLDIFRTRIVNEGLGCVQGDSAQRCDDALTCLAPAASGNLEAFNSCAAFSIPGTRLFETDDTGFIYELDPANGTVLNQGALPIPTTGTEHLALGYDAVGNRLFFHSSDNTAIDPVGGAFLNTEVIVFSSEDFSRITQWQKPSGLQIEGLGFGEQNNLITAFDVVSDTVNVLGPNDGAVAANGVYQAPNADLALFGGAAVDSFSSGASPLDTNPTNDRGFSTRSDQNQLQEFELGVGTPLGTVGAPAVSGLQCGLGVKGDFAFVFYTSGIARVVTTEDNVFPGLPKGSFITEYRTPGLNPCGGDAGGL
jgi:hypothetical protein